MVKGLKTVICLLAMFVLSEKGFSQISIIPKPAELRMKAAGDSFAVTPQTVVALEQPSLQPSVDFLNSYLQEVYGFKLKTSKKTSSQNRILLRISKMDNAVTGAYQMTVSKDGIVINGNEEAGSFYGVQTLLQMLPVQQSTQLSVPAVQINDAPRYQYAAGTSMYAGIFSRLIL